MSLLDLELLKPQSSCSLHLEGLDYIELYVSNAYQAAHFYRTALGLTPVAYSGLETGTQDRVSILMRQNDIRIALTNALAPESPIAEHVKIHGDSVKDIAFKVKDAAQSFEIALRRGARPIQKPTISEDKDGLVVRATIGGCCDMSHSFIQRDTYSGPFLPTYSPLKSSPSMTRTELVAIDHVAFSVEAGTLDEWAEFYTRALGFNQSHQEDITTEYSAMNSKVMQSDDGRIKFTLMEPAASKRRSQIEEYLAFHRGPGAQHAAFLSNDIVKTVQALRDNGIDFLHTPKTYYDMLEDRVGKLKEDLAVLRDLNILVDRDECGYLMQIFTKPIQSRPTFFLEVIQREGSRGFGSGNIKALFEAIEREQALRGNL